MKRKITFFIIFFVLILPMFVYASDDASGIYISGLGFGHPSDFMSGEEKTAVDLQKELSKSEEYILHDDRVMKVTDGTYTDNNSDLIFNQDIFKKISDRNWLKEILHEFKGINEDIQEVAYTVDYFMNQKTGSVNYKEVWLFMKDNVYIIDMFFDETIKENDLPCSIEVSDVKDYKEWLNSVVYKSVGACYINDKCVAENVYFNEYEGTVPLRAVIENIGGIVEWYPDEFAANVKLGEKEYLFTYYFRGCQHGGISIRDNNENYISLGRVSGMGKCFIQDGVTYMSRLTAERFFENIGYSVEEIHSENECAIVLKNILHEK